MDNKQTDKMPKISPKSFMTIGPTLHYSHKNVQRCWLLALVVFGACCLFWSKILTGSFWSFGFETITCPIKAGHLGQSVITGVSIFEYPWQIIVLGLLMGVLAVAPVLISQLLSFSYSLPFILAVLFLANLPGFAVCLLVSCVAAACRPLRFRSRFIAIALCTTPQLIYWAYFGGARGVEPIKWGFSFTPWICAWLTGLAIAGLVLGIGHFTRYRPGLVWAFTCLTLLAAVTIFEAKIGFDELDYQLCVANNDPEEINEFYDHSVTKALDETITNPTVIRYLADFFYPTEPIPLRAELKREIRTQLGLDRWPSWFIVGPELDYQSKRQRLLEQYDLFISQRPRSRRMPIALYYKALLSEYSPDLEMFEQKEVLHFYSDYPHERSRQIWYRLYSEFGNSPESIEARWRIAKHWAGQGKFEQADKLLAEAQTMAGEYHKLLEKHQPQSESFFSPFRPSPASAMMAFKLCELQRKLNQLRNLIGTDNRTNEPASAERLAKFVMLNPYSRRFAAELEELLEKTGDNDRLRDNILLAQAKLIADEHLRAESLYKLHKELQNTDGGMEALYELGLLRICQWRQQDQANSEQKKKYLTQARATLTNFISLYPESFCVEQVKKNLADLPMVD
jgi:hypothetical protein